jgi:TldD protein
LVSERREFLKQGAAAAALLAINRQKGDLWRMPGLGMVSETVPGASLDTLNDPAQVKALLMAAINAAETAGAQYADARIQRLQQNAVQTREQQILNIIDSDTLGCGVRAMVDGTWGFGATRVLTADGVAAAARQAVATARAGQRARRQPLQLAPAEAYPDATWTSPFATDPWTIAVEQKADLLLKANAQALKASNVKFVTSALSFVKEERNFASTVGSYIRQTVVRCYPTMQITAISADRTDFQTRQNVVPPMARGWEYVESCDLPGHAQHWGEQAGERLAAKPVDVGRYDLVLHPTNLWLTLHESIAHPTELDRAMGYEANYAGTSFVAPPDKMLGQFRYGPPIMNIQGDRSQAGALSSIGYDDEGIRPETFLIIKNGIVNDYQTTREQATWLKWWYDKQGRPVRSHGCCHSQSWRDVQFQRMPNVSLLPGTANHTWDDLIAATDRGIAIMGDGSFSIDQQRYNAQFSGQLFYEIRGGKIVGMLKDVAYQIRTPDFWNSMKMIGGKASYELNGTFSDGKGQPPQSNAVSHGTVPARFAQVNVINTGRKA